MLILREKLQKKLEKSTDERILIAKKANGVQYYLRINSKDKNGTYLQKSDISKIRRLVQKQYDEKVLKEINKELSILKRLIHSDQIKEDHIKQIYSNYPKEVKEYINPIENIVMKLKEINENLERQNIQLGNDSEK